MCAEFHMSCQVTGSEFEVGPEFRLQTLLEIGMVDKKEVGTVPKPFMQCRKAHFGAKYNNRAS